MFIPFILFTNQRNSEFFLDKLRLNGFDFWDLNKLWDSHTNFARIWTTPWRFKISYIWKNVYFVHFAYFD